MSKSIAEITVAITGGGTPARQIVEFWKGNIPWATVKDVKEGMKYLQDTEEHITETGLRSSASNLVTANSLIVCTRMAVGRSALTTRPTAINQDLKCLKIKPEYDVNFVYYQITNQQNTIEGQAIGSTVKGVSVGELRKLSFYCPDSLPVQRKIARILSTIDGQIEKTEAIIAKYQAIKQGMLQDLFTRGIDVRTGQLRPRYEDAPDLYKESPLGMIPTEWAVITLKDYMLEARGYIQTGPFGSQLHSHEYVLDGVPVVMPQDINEYTISTKIIARISQRKADALSKHKARRNDIIFARRGDVSRCAVINDEQIGWLCGTGCILMRLEKGGVISPDWFKVYYKSEKAQNQVVANSVGSMMVNLNSKVLNDLKIYRLSYREQLSIVSVLDSNDKSLLNLDYLLSKLQLLKQSLMQDLLSGTVAVKP